jgi:hypothetical protein
VDHDSNILLWIGSLGVDGDGKQWKNQSTLFIPSIKSIQSKAMEQSHDGVIVVVGWIFVSRFMWINTFIHSFGLAQREWMGLEKI